MTLGALIADATRPHADPAGRITVDGPPVMLNPKAAVSMVLAIHELATNAAKYGALSVTDGRVEICWQAKEGQLRLVWRESGGPPVSEPARRGFGLRMIERSMANDLAGTVTIGFAPDGLSCTLDAPLPNAAA